MKIESALFEEVQRIREDLKGIREMLDAWNNAKGFVTTMKNVGKLVIFFVPSTSGMFLDWRIRSTRRISFTCQPVL